MKTNRLIWILAGIALVALFVGVGTPTAKADGFFVGGGYYSGGSYYSGRGYSYTRTYYSRPCGYTVRYVAPPVVYRTYYPPPPPRVVYYAPAPRVVYYAPAPRPSFGFSFGFSRAHHHHYRHTPYYRPHSFRHGGHHRWR